MIKKNIKIQIVCFGEVLYDVLGNQHLPGGAPLNVAYHLSKLGVESGIISRVGKDLLGEELIDLIGNWGLDTSNVQTDPKYPTSEVLPFIKPDNEVQYEIKFPVAWDFIEYQECLQELVTDANAFVFGSLAGRNEVSRDTLIKLLKLSSYNVFDVNLRESNYNKETILELLANTQLLKMNENELFTIAGFLNYEGRNEADIIKSIQNTFEINETLVTKGEKGADYYTLGEVYHIPAYKIKLEDTIGSGDAFIASFLAGKFKELETLQNLKNASALGALVASKSGGCPDYNARDLERIIEIAVSP